MAEKHKNIIYGILKTKKEVYKLTKERVSIGRNRNSNIIINNNTISKDHAIIEFDEEYNAILKDLNSSNGTYVNGERLKFMPIRLKTGDKITFGKEKTEYIFESFNMNNDSKTEADMNQYMLNGNNINNESKPVYDQKINLVNENELSFVRMNHLQNNNNNINIMNKNNNNYNNGSYNNLKNGFNNNNREYYNEEDNNNFIYNDNNYNIEQSFKNKIDDLEKRNAELENEKEDLLKKNDETKGELNKKISELKKMTTLFDELNEEYSKLNLKHNELMTYASDVQKKLDIANIEISQMKKKCHGNEEIDKIINEKDNIISILQNEVNYYKNLCGKNNNQFNTFPSLDINNNLNITQKLDSLIEKYISDNKKLKQQNETYKRKIKILQKKEINNKKNNNIDFGQLEIQMNYQIDNFNNIINEYNERLSDSLTKISELFEQSKKEEAAKYLVEQVNDFMQENQRLINENAKLNTQILELQSQLNSQSTNINYPINNNIDDNDINDDIDNDNDNDNEEEINELKNKVEELENVIHKLKIGGNNNENNISNYNKNNNNIREAFVNTLNELKEKDKIITELQNKIKDNINNNLNYTNSKYNSIEQNFK